MFLAETTWLAGFLKNLSSEDLSPLLNVGSSTAELRETHQPWTEEHLFAPLKARDIEVIHLDARDGDGIDLKADITDADDVSRIQAMNIRAVLCCNILEHVRAPKRVADHCTQIVGPGGYIIVSVPYSYPRHRDPIDTLYRPTPTELQSIFPNTRMLEGEIIDAGESYLTQVRKRPWILMRHILRFPFPFIGYEDWRHSMRKPYWLFNNYKVTCAVFKVLKR